MFIYVSLLIPPSCIYRSSEAGARARGVSVVNLSHYHSVVLYMANKLWVYICHNSDSQVQAEAEAIKEEDLRLIQERELSIRQLEVWRRIRRLHWHDSRSRDMNDRRESIRFLPLCFLLTVWHHRHQWHLQGPGYDGARAGRHGRWVAHTLHPTTQTFVSCPSTQNLTSQLGISQDEVSWRIKIKDKVEANNSMSVISFIGALWSSVCSDQLHHFKKPQSD